MQIRAILTLGQAPPVPLALPASPRPSPPVSMCGAGGGLCFALAGAAPGVRLPAARVPRKPPLGRWRGLSCPPYADGLRGLWGLSPPDRLGKNHGSLRAHVNQISGRRWPPLPLVDSPVFVNSPPELPTANATKSGLLLRSAPPVRVFPTLILGTFATRKGRLFGFYPAERNKTQCYFVAFVRAFYLGRVLAALPNATKLGLLLRSPF